MSKPPQPFSILDYALAKKAGTFGRIASKESRAISDEHERDGLPDSGWDQAPWNALNTRATPLTAAGASNGGFLDQTNLQGYLQALQPRTNVMRLGATIVSLNKGDTVIPHGTSALTALFLPNEGTATAAVTPTFGQAVFVRKIVVVNVPITLQLMKQSNANEIVVGECVRGIAAGIDLAAIQGSGINGTPLGLLNNGAIANTSGTTLAYPTLVSVMESVANANVISDLSRLGWLGTPNVAGLLKTRYFSTANWPIWTGSIPAGSIDMQPAFSSTNVAGGSLIHGDFSQLLIAQWSDGLQITADPYTNFQNAVVTIQVSVSVDFAVANPAAFSVIKTIT
jgi:HK97 family phage major capsid protein